MARRPGLLDREGREHDQLPERPLGRQADDGRAAGAGCLMADFKRYRSKVLIEAKQLDHDGRAYDPRTGKQEPFRAGDYLIREPSGKQRVEKAETFRREYELIDQGPA